MIPVGLRSENPKLIETVRAVLAVNSIPLAVFPQSSTHLDNVGLALDDQANPTPWSTRARKRATVSLPTVSDPPVDTLIVPHQAKELVTLANAAVHHMRAHVLGVVGAVGGAGASVFAATLARVAAEEGLMTCLLEGQGNPALATLMHLEYAAGVRFADLPITGGDPCELIDSLPRWSGVRVVAGDDRPNPTFHQAHALVGALGQAHDVMVLDLQRSDVASGVAKQWCDEVVVVTPPTKNGVTASQALRTHLSNQPTHVVLRGPCRQGLGVGEVEELLGDQIAVYMRSERSLAAGMQRGLTPGDHRRGPLLRGARNLTKHLGWDG